MALIALLAWIAWMLRKRQAKRSSTPQGDSEEPGYSPHMSLQYHKAMSNAPTEMSDGGQVYEMNSEGQQLHELKSDGQSTYQLKPSEGQQVHELPGALNYNH